MDLSFSTLSECLEAVCAVHNRSFNNKIIEIYFFRLGDLEDSAVMEAFSTVLDERNFPTPARIRELVTGIVPDADWHEIMSVVNGSKKSATISGISAEALITATTSAGINSHAVTNAQPSGQLPCKYTAALRKIAFCDDPFTLRSIRKDWTELTAVPPTGKVLLPARVEISLESAADKADIEYPKDLDYKFQAAAMIRCIKDKGSVGAMWVPIIERFPAARKAEVMEFIKANGFITPALEATPLYRKYLSIGEAMREINEAEINEVVGFDRQASASNGSLKSIQQILEHH